MGGSVARFPPFEGECTEDAVQRRQVGPTAGNGGARRNRRSTPGRNKVATVSLVTVDGHLSPTETFTRTSGVATATVPYSGHRDLKP